MGFTILNWINRYPVLGRIRHSFQMASSMISVVVAYYFFDHIDFTGITEEMLLKRVIIVCQFILCTGVKVAIIAGGLGNIAKIVWGEDLLLNKESFTANIVRYWGIVLLCSFLPAVIHFSIFILTGIAAPFDLIANACDIPLLMILGLCFQVSADNRRRIERRKVGWELLFMVSLSFVFVIASNTLINRLIPVDNMLLSLLRFCIKGFELVFFVYFVGSIYKTFDRNAAQDQYQLILVNPPFSGTLQALSSLALWFTPAVFIVIRALTPKNYVVKQYNRVYWRGRYYQSGALVGITCLTANSAEAYKIAKEFRNRGSKVVMGGPHVSIFPEEALDFCNSVVIGPVESVWRTILSDYEAGNLKSIYSATPRSEDVAKVRSYLAEQSPEILANFLETRRGCKFKCYFCANPSLQKDLSACTNDVDQMIQYLKVVASRYKQVSFMDTNIYADPSYMKELLRAMAPMGIKWGASASIDIATDDEALDLLRKSGCTGLLIGYEIPGGSQEAERGGKLALAKKYVELTRKLKQVGIKVKGHFIFGFENDGWLSLGRLWLYCFLLWPYATALSFLTPIPGSAFFNEMVQKNKIRDLNWRSYNLHTLVFEHPRLDNWLYRKAFSLVMLCFLTTTSSFGLILLFLCSSVLFIAVRFFYS